jgi:hypothetical protein
MPPKPKTSGNSQSQNKQKQEDVEQELEELQKGKERKVVQDQLVWFWVLDADSGQPYKGMTVTSISHSDVKNPTIDFFRSAVLNDDNKDKGSTSLFPFTSAQLIVYKNMTAFEKRNNAVNDGKEEPLKYNFPIEGLGSSKEDPLIVAIPSSLILQVEMVKELLQNGSAVDIETQELKKEGLHLNFCDRKNSQKLLADCMQKRFEEWRLNHRCKIFQSIPYLGADGPGTGKTRFLEELPKSFKKYVLESSVYSKEFKEAIKSALYIKISFGHDTPYERKELDLHMKDSILFRIIYGFQKKDGRDYDRFVRDELEGKDIDLETTLRVIGKGVSCIVLAIDDVNKIHDLSRDHFNFFFVILAYNIGHFQNFLVPILGGTTITPLNREVGDMIHQIPLPSLSLSSVVGALETKIPDFETLLNMDTRFSNLLTDIDGHCRSLEIFYETLRGSHAQKGASWDEIFHLFSERILKAYPAIIKEPLFGQAIAHCLLPIHVYRSTVVADRISKITFEELAETGILSLIESRVRFQVRIPFLFIRIYLKSRIPKASFTKLFSATLLYPKITWQEWESFNQNYMVLKLAMFRHVGSTTLYLVELFDGAKKNVKHMRLELPSDLQITKTEFRFPPDLSMEYERINKESQQWINLDEVRAKYALPSEGWVIKNTDGAPFNFYVQLKNRDGNNVILLFHTKFGTDENIRSQVIRNEMLFQEYWKIRRLFQALQDNLEQDELSSQSVTCVSPNTTAEEIEIEKNSLIIREAIRRLILHLKEVEIVIVFLCGCETDLTAPLPEDCVVVSRDELEAFYGSTFAKRFALSS